MTKTNSNKTGSLLLQNYLMSLLSMVLCAAMFLGTSFAWFTSEVENQGNEIYVGTLAVELEKKDREGNFVSLSDKRNGVNINTLFESDIRWEPGYTAVETIRITNEGNLAFRYGMTFTDGKITGNTNAALSQVAKNFVVYIHEGDYAAGEAKPGSFGDIEQSDAWKPVMNGSQPATLADILENGLHVVSGSMTDVRDTTATAQTGQAVPGDAKNTSHTYLLALHMNNTATAEIMGSRLSLNVKLVAYQMTHEEDAMGDNYDDISAVFTLAELQNAINNAKDGDTIALGCDISGNATVEQKKNVSITIDGGGNTFDGTLRISGGSRDSSETLTIKNINFVADDADNLDDNGNVYACVDAYWGNTGDTRYAHNVTVEGCTFTMTGAAKHKVAAVDLYQPYNILVKNCTVTGAHSALQNKGGHEGLTVDGVKAIDCKNGISLGTAETAVVRNCDIESVVAYGYGIRADVSGAYSLVLENNTVKAAAPVLLRKASGAFTAALSGNELITTGTYHVIVANNDYEEGKALVAPTGAYTLTGADGLRVYNG